jgi:uncharacterized protein
MKNPFEYGRELDLQELVNRIEEMKIVEETIDSGGKLFVIGPRRFGKTSLLNAVAEKRIKKGDIILNYNAESFPEIQQLVRKIIADSARLLKGKAENVAEKIKGYFKKLNPEVSFSFTQTEWKTTLGTNVLSESPNQIYLLVDALNGLENLATEQEKRVALIIDEFQEILSQDKIQAEKQIRSAIQKHRHTAYIFAGSKTRMLNEMVTDPSRPFYRLGRNLYIGEIPKPEFTRFLIDKFTLGDFFKPKTEESEKARLALIICKLAEDVPYNVQMLAHNLWSKLTQIKIASPETAHLSEELIQETLKEVIRQSDVFYTQVWNNLTNNHKKTLTAVVSENGENLFSKTVTIKTKMSSSTIQRSLGSLTNQDILREVESRGRKTFRFEDPFFAKWISLFIFSN